MNTIKKIIRAVGYDGVDELDVNELIEVENEPFMEINVELLADNRLSVAHYYTQRGDLMSDPEIVFDISGEEWTPIEYTQHGVPNIHQHNPDGLNDASGFVDDWDDRLDDQGFVEAAREQFEDDNNE